MPGWFEQAGNKIGGFFKDPAKVTSKAFEVGPPGGKTPQINPDQVAPPIQIENPYAAAGAGAATAQKSFADALANYSGLGQTGVSNLMGQLAGPQNLEGLGAIGREAVSGLIGQLQSQAAGQAGPGSSLAQALLQQGLTQNIAGVRSQLASQRGLSPAIRARLAAQQTAALGGQTAQQAGIMGLQQQLAAIDRLGSLGMGATDIAQKQQEATRSQLGQLASGAASLGAEGALRGYGQLSQSDVAMREIQARTGLGEKEIAAKLAEANQAAAAGDKQRATNIVTSIFGGGAQLGSAYVSRNKAYGGRIDGEAPYAGDTPKNDVVPANLSPGEIVIPRTAAGSKKEAKAFIDALDDWDEEPSYGKVLKARQKKNYADGGKVEFPLGGPYAPMNPEKIGASYDQELPVAQKMKQSFDQFLTERVVEPLAQRGYPTLGAALATVPSVAADVMIPSTTGELQAGVIPFPGAKLTKAAKEALKKEGKLEKAVVDEVIQPKLTESKKTVLEKIERVSPEKNQPVQIWADFMDSFQNSDQFNKMLESGNQKAQSKGNFGVTNRTYIENIREYLKDFESQISRKKYNQLKDSLNEVEELHLDNDTIDDMI